MLKSTLKKNSKGLTLIEILWSVLFVLIVWAGTSQAFFATYELNKMSRNRNIAMSHLHVVMERLINDVPSQVMDEVVGRAIAQGYLNQVSGEMDPLLNETLLAYTVETLTSHTFSVTLRLQWDELRADGNVRTMSQSLSTIRTR